MYCKTCRFKNKNFFALSVFGDKDPDFIVPHGPEEWITESIGMNASQVMIPNAGHYPNVECPVQVASEIFNFIQKQIFFYFINVSKPFV